LAGYFLHLCVFYSLYQFGLPFGIRIIPHDFLS
jgi:hypothetical protein